MDSIGSGIVRMRLWVPTVACVALIGTLRDTGLATNVVGVAVPSQVAVAALETLEQVETLKLMVPACPA